LVKFLRPSGRDGYDPTPGCVRTGLNSGYQSTHLAMQAGATKILLFGLDMSVKHGVHWHGPHVGGLGNPDENLFRICRRHFATLADAARKMGVEIINCSEISELDTFPKMDPLAAIEQHVP
jgi:hypothetical protein